MDREPEQITDEWLVLSAQAGSPAAVEMLVRRWQPKLLAHACQVTGRRDAANDVVQETWLSILRSLDRLRDPAAFRGWAYRIVHFRAVDWLRQNRRQRDADRTQIQQNQHADGVSTDNAVDDRQDLAAAIERLRPDEKLLLRMYYLENTRIEEIAIALKLPSGTVKYRLFRLRQELKRFIEGEHRATQKHGSAN